MSDRSQSGSPVDQGADPMRWAMDLGADAAMASVNWLAADIDSARPTAEALLTNPDVPVKHLLAAKRAYKTLRIVGETSDERLLGARWYAATIAAGIIHRGELITSQSDGALDRAFSALVDEPEMPVTVRELVVRALFRLRNGMIQR
ncbi:MAG: hypothetical protein AB8G96_02345 [Phycisphaerales bacterium]